MSKLPGSRLAMEYTNNWYALGPSCAVRCAVKINPHGALEEGV